MRPEQYDPASSEWTATGGWSVVCSGACDVDVPMWHFAYRASGPEISSSETFRLVHMRSEGKPIELLVAPGSRSRRAAGIVLTSVGGLATRTGGILLGAGLLVNTAGRINGGPGNDADYYAGGSVAVVGVAALISGIVLLVSGGTTVTFRDDAAVSTGEKADDTWLRLPVRHEGGAWIETSSSGMTVPLVSGAF